MRYEAERDLYLEPSLHSKHSRLIHPGSEQDKHKRSVWVEAVTHLLCDAEGVPALDSQRCRSISIPTVKPANRNKTATPIITTRTAFQL